MVPLGAPAPRGLVPATQQGGGGGGGAGKDAGGAMGGVTVPLSLLAFDAVSRSRIGGKRGGACVCRCEWKGGGWVCAAAVKT